MNQTCANCKSSRGSITRNYMGCYYGGRFVCRLPEERAQHEALCETGTYTAILKSCRWEGKEVDR